ncbi:molybdopterin-guanine dinucleotide biosynthesis protein B [Roseococcus suduntuyensis]|uniref:Molybdopterin-guanine dinucleotide biosynthesis protein B n=1 Tax=Roseococcus suduntuyensis TaxID=455361 RepID=A0A840AH01_9PROT|nr:molybdopterin-guanine dinucleotide biosynthesis protein B [Roseococcus suduntuyensis]MBB3900351.1 molybdopterin-guanine dinucleotide biosynthesis protein B [Roseococcus suduntuyensis]
MRVIGFAGWSGAGKTTLVTRLIPFLAGQGVTVSTIKHAHSRFDLDRPGKDSHAHREAGAAQVLLASSQRWALLTELRGAPEPELPELLAQLAPVDLVLVEGFKSGPHPRIEVHRAALGQPFLYPDHTGIVALASDAPPPPGAPQHLSLDDIPAIGAAALRLAVPRAAL